MRKNERGPNSWRDQRGLRTEVAEAGVRGTHGHNFYREDVFVLKNIYNRKSPRWCSDVGGSTDTVTHGRKKKKLRSGTKDNLLEETHRYMWEEERQIDRHVKTSEKNGEGEPQRGRLILTETTKRHPEKK